ncbi:MAG TPA: hypothetical protein VFD36_23590 [Kofleriaceae bacterium]|nr:hypothetical protein [Kofleriaceae bacterium]
MTIDVRVGAVAAIAALAGTAHADEPTPPTTTKAVPLTTQVAIAPDDGDGAVRLSLPTEEDRAAWRRSGFRLALGIVYGELHGARQIPDLTLKGVAIRPGIRIDPEWSIYLPLQYATTSLGGARFAAAVEPTWHIAPSIALGLGVGYAGLIGVSTYNPFAPPSGPELDVDIQGQSYTFPEGVKPVRSCDGVGITAAARLEAGYVLGPRSRTHVALEALAQRTGCEEGGGGSNAFTGTDNMFRQWWVHRGMSLSWSIEWR